MENRDGGGTWNKYIKLGNDFSCMKTYNADNSTWWVSLVVAVADPSLSVIRTDVMIGR